MLILFHIEISLLLTNKGTKAPGGLRFREDQVFICRAPSSYGGFMYITHGALETHLKDRVQGMLPLPRVLSCCPDLCTGSPSWQAR